MKELKFDRWNGRVARPAAGLLLLGFSLRSSHFELLVSEKVFLEKRTQTLPVIIDVGFPPRSGQWDPAARK
jgi:hypothetical protein